MNSMAIRVFLLALVLQITMISSKRNCDIWWNFTPCTAQDCLYDAKIAISTTYQTHIMTANLENDVVKLNCNPGYSIKGPSRLSCNYHHYLKIPYTGFPLCQAVNNVSNVNKNGSTYNETMSTSTTLHPTDISNTYNETMSTNTTLHPTDISKDFATEKVPVDYADISDEDYSKTYIIFVALLILIALLATGMCGVGIYAWYLKRLLFKSQLIIKANSQNNTQTTRNGVLLGSKLQLVCPQNKDQMKNDENEYDELNLEEFSVNNPYYVTSKI